MCITEKIRDLSITYRLSDYPIIGNILQFLGSRSKLKVFIFHVTFT